MIVCFLHTGWHWGKSSQEAAALQRDPQIKLEAGSKLTDTEIVSQNYKNYKKLDNLTISKDDRASEILNDMEIHRRSAKELKSLLMKMIPKRIQRNKGIQVQEKKVSKQYKGEKSITICEKIRNIYKNIDEIQERNW